MIFYIYVYFSKYILAGYKIVGLSHVFLNQLFYHVENVIVLCASVVWEFGIRNFKVSEGDAFTVAWQRGQATGQTDKQTNRNSLAVHSQRHLPRAQRSVEVRARLTKKGPSLGALLDSYRVFCNVFIFIFTTKIHHNIKNIFYNLLYIMYHLEKFFSF